MPKKSSNAKLFQDLFKGSNFVSPLAAVSAYKSNAD